MNLIDKLTVNYREAVDIVNPFYFLYSQERDRVPVYTMGHEMPTSFVHNSISAKVELSANPDNININVDTMGQQKELTIYNKGQLFTLKDITEIICTRSPMTGCYEFNIRCGTLILGGND